MVNEAGFCWVWRLEVFKEKCLYFMFMEESTYIVVGALGGGVVIGTLWMMKV